MDTNEYADLVLAKKLTVRKIATIVIPVHEFQMG